ncbi:MAG: hypothetical protein V1859_06560, partial [archaeon]
RLRSIFGVVDSNNDAGLTGVAPVGLSSEDFQFFPLKIRLPSLLLLSDNIRVLSVKFRVIFNLTPYMLKMAKYGEIGAGMAVF